MKAVLISSPTKKTGAKRFGFSTWRSHQAWPSTPTLCVAAPPLRRNGRRRGVWTRPHALLGCAGGGWPPRH